LIFVASLSPKPSVAEFAGRLTLNWWRTLAESKATLSIQVCVEPPMRRGLILHDQLFEALHNLDAELPRFQPRHLYPKLAVAELEPPGGGKTSWDFSLLDPLLMDFMQATAGHPVGVNVRMGPERGWGRGGVRRSDDRLHATGDDNSGRRSASPERTGLGVAVITLPS